MGSEITKQFIEKIIDQPERAEKIFLWTLQALITLWCFLLFGYDIISIAKNIETSLLDIATSIILFTIVWGFAWGGLIDILVVLLLELFNQIIRFIRAFLPYLIKLLLIQKPKFVWKQKKIQSPPVDYSELMSIIGGLKIIDNITGSSIGSINMQKILSVNRKQIIKTRVIRYYSILLIITIANIGFYKFTFGNIWWITILLLTLLFFGLLIIELLDLQDRIDSKYIHYIQPIIEMEIYINFIYRSLLKTPFLLEEYSIRKEREVIVLTLREEKTIYEDAFQKILVVPTDVNDYSYKITKTKEDNPEALLVFVSKDNFPLYDLNKISDARYCFIQTKDEIQLIEALKLLRPIFFIKPKSVK